MFWYQFEAPFHLLLVHFMPDHVFSQFGAIGSDLIFETRGTEIQVTGEIEFVQEEARTINKICNNFIGVHNLISSKCNRLDYDHDANCVNTSFTLRY